MYQSALVKLMSFLWGAVLAVFLGVMFVSFFYSPSHAAGAPGDKVGCPFMSHEEVICSMSLFDHVSAWKATFVFTVPSLSLLFLAAATLMLVASVAPNRLVARNYCSRLPVREFCERSGSFIYRQWQELFSCGILHPKVF